MKQKSFLISACIVLVFILTGCGKSVEEQIDTGVIGAQTVFKEKPQSSNTTVGDIELYLPQGYEIEKTEDPNNLILTKGKDNYLLFVNYNESENSRLHYELLMEDASKEIIKEQQIELDGEFGFTAVAKHAEEQFELIVSSGGVKMSTISKDKKLDEKLEEMMEIVRSVNHVEVASQTN